MSLVWARLDQGSDDEGLGPSLSLYDMNEIDEQA